MIAFSHKKIMMSLVALILFILLTCSATLAGGRPYWTVILPVQDGAEKSSTWVRYALGTAISHRLRAEPSSDLISWVRLKEFYTEEGLSVPDKAWSFQELAAVACKCGLKVVIVGRYKLDGGILSIRFRVWTSSGLGETQSSMKLSEAHYKISDVIENVARISGLVKNKKKISDRPFVSSSEEFEMFGRLTEAYAQGRHNELLRLSHEWVKRHPHSTLEAYTLALLIYENAPSILAKRLEIVGRKRLFDRGLWETLGWAREESSDLKGAQTAYQKELSLDPQNPITYIDLVRVTHKLGEKNEANKLQSLADSLPYDWQNHLWAGLCYYDHKDYANAERHLEAALKTGVSRYIILDYLGCVLSKQKKYEQAIHTWQSALRIYPKNVDTLADLAYAYGEIRNYQEYERCVRKLLEIDNKDIGARCGLVWVLRKQGKYNEAKAEAEMVIKLDPKNLYAHRMLAKIYRRQGKPLQEVYHLVLSLPNVRRAIGPVLIMLSIIFIVLMTILALAIKHHLTPDGPSIKKNSSKADVLWRKLDDD